MRILLTNDDGIYAPGLRALRERLKSLGEVVVVAPAAEQSAAAHSITLTYPLLVQEIWEGGEHIGFAVEGKPADCVKLGLVALLGQPPDLVVSGINSGANAGINVLYSGTVAAAIEGAFFKMTSIAVSLEFAEMPHYPKAADIVVNVIGQILERDPAPGDLFNVNIPCLARHDPVGVRVVEQGLACYRESYEARLDPRGRRYYWLLPESPRDEAQLDNDITALANRFVTITPLHFDLTARDRMRRMADWQWKL